MNKILVSVCFVMALTGCQNSDIFSGDVFTADQAQRVQSVSYGTVTSARAVRIQTNATAQGNNNVLGSLGGAVVGGAIQDQASQTNAVELEIRQDNGATIVIVQKATANQFHVGQEVRLVTDGKQINVSPRTALN